MKLNWVSLLLVLFDFAKDAGTIWAGYVAGKGDVTKGAVIAAAVVAIGKLAVVIGQNQPPPGVSTTRTDTSSKGA